MEAYLQFYCRYIFQRRLLPEDFIRHRKRNADIPHNVPKQIRNIIQKRALEARLHSHVVMIRRQTNIE